MINCSDIKKTLRFILLGLFNTYMIRYANPMIREASLKKFLVVFVILFFAFM